PEPIARHIAYRIEETLLRRHPTMGQFVVMDSFCGAGGNAIQFALLPTVARVYAIDIDPAKIEMARHHATIYGCADKIEFIVGDVFQVVASPHFDRLVDVCFYSSPWGGPDYIKRARYSLNDMVPNGFDICRHTSRYLTANIA